MGGFFRTVVLPTLPLAGFLFVVTVFVNGQDLFWPLLVALEPDTWTVPLSLISLQNSFTTGEFSVAATIPLVTVLLGFLAVVAFQLLAYRVGRLATVSAAGQPHVVPTIYHFADGVFRIGARPLDGRGQGRLYMRHIEAHPRVAFVIDDHVGDPPRPLGVTVKGVAVVHPDGGERLSPASARGGWRSPRTGCPRGASTPGRGTRPCHAPSGSSVSGAAPITLLV